MRRGVIWFVVTLVAYVLILYYFGGYEIPSYIYHTLLLVFPLFLIFTNRDSIQQLGLVKGDWKSGLSIACGVIIITLIIFRFRYGEFSLPVLNSGLINTVIMAPITEELFFRGYFQPKLETRYGKWVGIVITAALFMVVHLPKILFTPLAGLINLPALFILGCIFGIIRSESKSVYYPMLCHAGYNFIYRLVFSY
ncbi:lysostaphin resistance A-like protein [Chloroflexota bacterium]